MGQKSKSKLDAARLLLEHKEYSTEQTSCNKEVVISPNLA
jgi:hypothetical protein